MTVKTVKAVYKRGKLVFQRADQVPTDGSTVVVSFAHDDASGDSQGLLALASLRGRGRGEKLGKRLLAERKADRLSEKKRHGR